MAYLWDGDEWRWGAYTAPTGGGGTPFISTLSDLNYLQWEPANLGSPPVPSNSSFHTITAPSGPGFEVVCTDALNQTAWNAGADNAVLAMKTGVTALGQTQDWTWNMYLPTQSITHTQYVLWEFHTNSSSGHFIGINSDLTYKIARQSAYGENYEINYSGGTPVLFDVWQPCRMYVKWSLAGDGFLQMWINGVQVKNYTGATQFAGDGTPYLQFGWYGHRPFTTPATVRFANIQRTVT